MKRKLEPLVLFPHQEVGITRILHGFCTATYLSKSGVHKPTKSILLHDDMGLGKTIQAIEALRRMLVNDRLNGAGPTLIVAPASCLHVWQTEITNWFSDYFYDVRVFINDSATLETLRATTNRTIIVTSYSTLRSAFQAFLYRHLSLGSISNAELARLCVVSGTDTTIVDTLMAGDNRQELLKLARTDWNEQAKKGIATKHAGKTLGYVALIRLDYGTIIEDEVHTIKNVSSKACKAVAFVSARYRIGLSGTPTMNHGGEMLTILKYGLGLFDVNWVQVYREPDGAYCRK